MLYTREKDGSIHTEHVIIEVQILLITRVGEARPIDPLADAIPIASLSRVAVGPGLVALIGNRHDFLIPPATALTSRFLVKSLGVSASSDPRATNADLYKPQNYGYFSGCSEVEHRLKLWSVAVDFHNAGTGFELNAILTSQSDWRTDIAISVGRSIHRKDDISTQSKCSKGGTINDGL